MLIGDGLSFFDSSTVTSPPSAEVKAYKNGMVALRYEVRRDHGDSRTGTSPIASLRHRAGVLARLTPEARVAGR